MADGDAAILRESEVSAELDDAMRQTARRKRLRWVLLTLGPLLLLILGVYGYVTGGRYVSTDNAYVKADVTTISTDVGGTVAAVAVRNNEAVSAGQLLFRLEDEPYRIALAGAEARLGMVRNEIDALRATYHQKLADLDQAQSDIAFLEREYQRQLKLAEQKVAAQARLDEARHNLEFARAAVASLRQEAASVLASLSGDVGRPVEKHPRYLRAKAARDQAARDLAHTRMTAPMGGIVTNVDALQPGEYLAAAEPAFSLVGSETVWVEANPKETDLTYVRPGQSATVTVDTYPGHEWRGVVAGVSPATGAEFAVLPPQNASGNWVKVVQRIPVRIRIETAEATQPLRAGMSATVDIDTGHQRSLPGVVKSALAWVGLGH
jgi:membrane fusion protein, multidrug efflux system